MGSDSSSHIHKTTSRGVSTRKILVEELQKTKEKLKITPHPYCEPKCTWLLLCRISSPPGCILNDLIDPNSWS